MSTVTRWWWIRHAPVVNHGGRIYGQDDLDCDCTDMDVFRRLARLMPADALWVTSHLSRAKATARAILDQLPEGAAGPEPLVEPALAEQHFGAWQGLSHDELAAQRDGAWHRFWLAPAEEAPPGGESFVQVIARVADAIGRLSAAHAGRDIVAVSHGGTIRAALAIALHLDPERALAIATDNCALTRIDHIEGPSGSHRPDDAGVWRVAVVNLAPKFMT